jgi:hypothetical protein
VSPNTRDKINLLDPQSIIEAWDRNFCLFFLTAPYPAVNFIIFWIFANLEERWARRSALPPTGMAGGEPRL